MSKTGKITGVISTVNRWGTGIKVEGKDVWMSLSKKAMEEGKIAEFEKGDMCEMEYNFIPAHDDQEDKVWINALKVKFRGDPETNIAKLGKAEPEDGPQRYGFTDYKTAPAISKQYLTQKHTSNAILIPREVALKAACELFTRQTDPPPPNFVLDYAEEFEKWITRGVPGPRDDVYVEKCLTYKQGITEPDDPDPEVVDDNKIPF